MVSPGLNGIKSPISKAFELYQMDIVHQVLQKQYETETTYREAPPLAGAMRKTKRERYLCYLDATIIKLNAITMSQNLKGTRNGMMIQPSSMVTIRSTVKIATSFKVERVLLSIAISKNLA